MVAKVSVVVPIYNTERYLRRCVDSLLNQTLKEIEVILVDDASPDEAPKICDCYAVRDQRVKVIHKTNEGLGLARNSGMSIASGEYITFIDSDDYLDLDAFETLYNIAKTKDLDICYGSFCYDMNSGKQIKKFEVRENTFFFGREEVDCFLLDMVGPEPAFSKEVKYSVSACKAIFRLDVFRKNKLFFSSEKKIASEDFLFHLKLLSKVERIGLLPICYYHYCENGESISHTYTDAKFERIRLSMIEVKKLLTEIFPKEKFFLHYQRCLFLSLRGLLAHEFERCDVSILRKLSLFKERCSNSAYTDLFSNYPFWQLNIIKSILYLSMKYRLSIPIYLIFLLKSKMGKL